jgi:hypothetical protein
MKLARQMFPEWSERTRARWARAMRMMVATGVPGDVQKTVLKNATRPNGSFNVAEFERRAEDVAAAWLVERESDG